MAGIIVAFLTGSGMLLRAIPLGEVEHLKALLIGFLFIPSLVLALGTMSGTKKLFEVSYLLIWYIGPINRLASLDFMGATGTEAAMDNPPIYMGIALALTLLAFMLRRRQVSVGLE